MKIYTVTEVNTDNTRGAVGEIEEVRVFTNEEDAFKVVQDALDRKNANAIGKERYENIEKIDGYGKPTDPEGKIIAEKTYDVYDYDCSYNCQWQIREHEINY